METRAYGAVIIGSKFGWPTTYEILVQFPDAAWSIMRRYSDFEALREKVLAQPGLPTLPPKAGPSMLKSAFRDVRQEGLDSFLSKVIDLFPRLECDALATFLGVSDESRQSLLAERGASSSPSAEAESILPIESSLDPTTPRIDEVVLEDSPSSVTELAAEAANAEAPSDMRDIRELRRQQWLQKQAQQATAQPSTTTNQPDTAAVEARSSGGYSAATSSGATAVAAVGSSAASTQHAQTSTEARVVVYPCADLPSGYASSPRCIEALQAAATDLRKGGSLERGQLLRADGHSFIVANIGSQQTPSGDARETFIVESDTLPKLKRVQLGCFKQADEDNYSEERLIAEFVQPYCRSILSEETRCLVLSPGETLDIFGKAFHVVALDPPGSTGLVDTKTVMFAHQDDAAEFERIHIVPFSDTMPSAYNFDVFNDYLKPYFCSHPLDHFEEGTDFHHCGIHFKVVATVPTGKLRVGTSTEVFSEGCLHPTVTNFLSPEQVRRLSRLPPGLQAMILQSDVFGDSNITERIIRAQERHEDAVGVSPTFLDRNTKECMWSPALCSELGGEQTECCVCLCKFVDGDRVRALPCQHVFHANCVDEWLGRDTHCPLCRSSFSSPGARA